MQKYLPISKKCSTFAPAFEKKADFSYEPGRVGEWLKPTVC